MILSLQIKNYNYILAMEEDIEIDIVVCMMYYFSYSFCESFKLLIDYSKQMNHNQ